MWESEWSRRCWRICFQHNLRWNRFLRNRNVLPGSCNNLSRHQPAGLCVARRYRSTKWQPCAEHKYEQWYDTGDCIKWVKRMLIITSLKPSLCTHMVTNANDNGRAHWYVIDCVQEELRFVSRIRWWVRLFTWTPEGLRLTKYHLLWCTPRVMISSRCTRSIPWSMLDIPVEFKERLDVTTGWQNVEVQLLKIMEILHCGISGSTAIQCCRRQYRDLQSGDRWIESKGALSYTDIGKRKYPIVQN